MTPHLIVVGSGVAGLSCALRAAADGAQVTLVIPGHTIASSAGNTQLAQGGIAAALDAADSPEQHAHDTITAGAGLTNPEAARVLTTAGLAEVRALLATGFVVDRGADGSPQTGLEGAHGVPRIVHAGEDRTGAALHAFLAGEVEQYVARDAGVVIHPDSELTRIIVQHGRASGIEVRLRSGESDVQTQVLMGDAVVLATGGYAGIYPRASSAATITGLGILTAAHAGALLADLEFVQFHPTVIEGTRHLVSEAVRGAGAVLLDGNGDRLMPALHPQADLAPRDVVARTMYREIQHASGAVWLDARPIENGEPGALRRRFTGITAVLDDLGIDWTREPVPVAPAAHYTMGGIATDLHGRSSVPGLFAVGEAASTGVHGANRLASNSLLEGLVFGGRAAQAASDFAHTSSWAPDMSGLGRGLASVSADSVDTERVGTERAESVEPDHLIVPVATVPVATVPITDAPITDGLNRGTPVHRVASDATVGQAVERGLGIERSASEIRAAAEHLRHAVADPAHGHTAQLALLVAAAAEARTESRGAHQRGDAPTLDPTQARRRVITAVFDTATSQPAKEHTSC